MRHLHGGPAERRVHTLRPHSDVSCRWAAAALRSLPALGQNSTGTRMLCVLSATGAAAARGSATRAATWSAQCESHLLLDARAKQRRGGARCAVVARGHGWKSNSARPPRCQAPPPAGAVRSCWGGSAPPLESCCSRPRPTLTGADGPAGRAPETAVLGGCVLHSGLLLQGCLCVPSFPSPLFFSPLFSPHLKSPHLTSPHLTSPHVR